jgi:ribosomal protein L16 Arg81 hydroxylase
MAVNRFLDALAPLSAAQLLQEHWEVRPLVIPATSAKFESLGFDFEQFIIALNQMPRDLVRANVVSPAGEGRYINIDPREARRHFDAGATICVTEIDRHLPHLAALANDTKGVLNLAGTVCCNCYVSPEGAGFGLHFDRQSVFLLQIEGSKHWRFAARPAVEFPPEAIDALPEMGRRAFRTRYPQAPLSEPSASEWLEATLGPGDVLYLPPGTWHRGRAGKYSLAITLTCCTCDFSTILTRVLQHQLFSQLAWRRNLPASVKPESHNGLPISVESFCADRLAELRSFVAALEPDDFASAWHSQVNMRR